MSIRFMMLSCTTLRCAPSIRSSTSGSTRLMRKMPGGVVAMAGRGGRGGSRGLRRTDHGRRRRSAFPAANEWAVTSDGTVAVVRWQDYRIDWIGADGKATLSPRIAHEWKRLSDDEKVRIAESLTVETASARMQLFWRGSPAMASRCMMSLAVLLECQGPGRPPLRLQVARRPCGRNHFLPRRHPQMISHRSRRVFSRTRTIISGFRYRPRCGSRARLRHCRSGWYVIPNWVRTSSSSIEAFGPGGNIYFFVRDGGGGHLECILSR